MVGDFGSKKRRKRSLMLEEAPLNLKWKFQLVSLLWKLLGVGGGGGGDGGGRYASVLTKPPYPKIHLNIKPKMRHVTNAGRRGENLKVGRDSTHPNNITCHNALNVCNNSELLGS